MAARARTRAEALRSPTAVTVKGAACWSAFSSSCAWSSHPYRESVHGGMLRRAPESPYQGFPVDRGATTLSFTIGVVHGKSLAKPLVTP